jgi:hypothetical protein
VDSVQLSSSHVCSAFVTVNKMSPISHTHFFSDNQWIFSILLHWTVEACVFPWCNKSIMTNLLCHSNVENNSSALNQNTVVKENEKAFRTAAQRSWISLFATVHTTYVLWSHYGALIELETHEEEKHCVCVCVCVRGKMVVTAQRTFRREEYFGKKGFWRTR